MLKKGLKTTQYITYSVHHNPNEDWDLLHEDTRIPYSSLSSDQKAYLKKFFSSSYYRDDSIRYANDEMGQYGNMWYLYAIESKLTSKPNSKDVHVEVKGKWHPYSLDRMKKMYEKNLAINKKWPKNPPTPTYKNVEEQTFDGYFKAANANHLIAVKNKEWDERYFFLCTKVKIEYEK